MGAIDHGEDGNAQPGRQIGAGAISIEEPHDALDQDEVRLARRLVQKLAAMGLATHPEIELIDRRPRGPLQNHGVQKVGTRLKDPHPSAQLPVMTG